MRLFYACLGAAIALVVKAAIDKRALEGPSKRRVPADRPPDSIEDEITGPLSEV
jgi:hypothetical protein